jgi:hypothetical protein
VAVASVTFALVEFPFLKLRERWLLERQAPAPVAISAGQVATR